MNISQTTHENALNHSGGVGTNATAAGCTDGMVFSSRPVFGGSGAEESPVKVAGLIPESRTITTMGHTSEKPSTECDDH